MTDQDPKLWKTPKLVTFLEKAALAYRQGSPLIDDDTYDHVYLAELQRREPDHLFLNKVEAEPDFGSGRLKHPVPMLSTEKSYSVEETSKWVTRILNEANKQDIDEIDIRVMVTAKLDGLAAMFREDKLLATRGDGIQGNDITSSFDKGVVDAGNGISGVGELVMTTGYFEDHLKKLGYAHPRNICVGVVNSDEVNEDFVKALKDGAVRFVPYSTLNRWEGSFTELIEKHDTIQQQIKESCEYPTDGVVAEITHSELKSVLGSTSHHNRWQIAIKQRSEAKEATIKSIIWQTKRTGRVTPVLEVEPIELSGATVGRVTAHHAGNVKALQLGKGAVITVERSGEVIPKIVTVVKTASKTQIAENCASCGQELTWQRDFLVCNNHSACPAQIENTLEHFFKIHGQVDGFGSKSIEKLVVAGIDTLEKIYNSNEEDFLQAGFGPVQSKNLRKELDRSFQVEIEDWRFLGAFGIPQLGRGDSRRLLQHMRLDNLAIVTKEEVMAIEGFAEISSAEIVGGLKKKWSTIKHMLSLGFN
ncbi:MAG: DNA ligase, partial [SAR202 cluster bacterium]|nr:DNA ligase [SAR202 cluster bacterium]